MGLIDRAGTFRGNIIESSFGLTKNGFPQFIAKFRASEMYDPETAQWLDWSQYDETEKTGYFVLAGQDGNLGRNAEQLQKALGWSGASFEELDSTDYSSTVVQFRIKNEVYNNKPDLKVCWIDHADADPSTSLKTMDKTEIKALDAKFAKALKAFSGGNKPKAVPSGKPKPPTVKADPTPTTSTSQAPTDTPPETKKGKPKGKGAPTASGPQPFDLDNEPVESNLPATAADADDAWAQVEANVGKDTPPAQVEETWLKVVEDMGGPEAIENWADVRDIVLETLKQ